jgi:hypothetical protein
MEGADADRHAIAFQGTALASAWGLAAFLGAGMIARDLAEHRFSFYLSRPLSTGTILGGKILGGMILSMACGFLILSPLLFTQISARELLAFSSALMIGVLFLMLFFHTAAVMVRSRSLWLLLDLAILSLFGITAFFCVQTLFQHEAFQSASILRTGFCLFLFPVFTMAAYSQVSHGRSDLRRGHRFLSLTMAAGLFSGALIGGLYTLWVLNPGPSGLVSAEVCDTATQGDWVAIRGRGHWRGDYQVGYLLNVETRKSWKVDSPCIKVSADGRRAAWWGGFDAGSTRFGVWTLDLTKQEYRPVFTDIERSRGVSCLHLSPDGKRAVVVERNELHVCDLETGRRWISEEYRGDTLSRLNFLSSGHIRVYGREQDGSALTIQEMDLASGELITTGCLRHPEVGFQRVASWDPKTDRILVRGGTSGNTFLWLCEGATGKVILSLVSGEDWKNNPRAHFLEDGRVLLERVAGNQVQLQVLNAEGKSVDQWNLDSDPYVRPNSGERRWASLIGEVKPNCIWMYLRALGEPSAGALLELNLASRSVRVIKDHWPAISFNESTETNSLRSRLFKKNDGSLVIQERDGSLRSLTHSD